MSDESKTLLAIEGAMTTPTAPTIEEMVKWLDKCGWTEDFPMFGVIRSTLLSHAEVVKERDALRLQLKYPDPEDMPGELAAKYCPFKDPLHFHHDGCPSEWAVETRAKKAEAEVERLEMRRLRETSHLEGLLQKVEAALAEVQPLVEAVMKLRVRECDHDGARDE